MDALDLSERLAGRKRQRGADRDLHLPKVREEAVFFEDRLARQAARSVELRDDVPAVFEPQIVDAVSRYPGRALLG